MKEFGSEKIIFDKMTAKKKMICLVYVDVFITENNFTLCCPPWLNQYQTEDKVCCSGTQHSASGESRNSNSFNLKTNTLPLSPLIPQISDNINCHYTHWIAALLCLKSDFMSYVVIRDYLKDFWSPEVSTQDPIISLRALAQGMIMVKG